MSELRRYRSRVRSRPSPCLACHPDSPVRCLSRLAAVPIAPARSRRHLSSLSRAAALSDANHSPRLTRQPDSLGLKPHPVRSRRAVRGRLTRRPDSPEPSCYFIYSSLPLIVNTLACHAVYDLTLSWSEELLGDNHHQALRRLTPFLNKASVECIILLYASRYKIYFMYMIAHLRTGVG
jgi:hypothetical protein